MLSTHKSVTGLEQAFKDELRLSGLLPWVVEVDGLLEIRVENIKSVISQIQEDEKLVIVSIVGKFRQGKTFFMNILLNALKNNGKTRFGPGDIIGGAENFSFQNGDKGHTVGIMAYSKVLHVQKADNEKLAVILLDTQGIADPGKNEKRKDAFLTIASLFSSIMIFNIQKCFDNDSLRALYLMVELGQKTRELIDPEQAAFGAGSDLMVLIRDSAMGKCGFGLELESLKELLKNSTGTTDMVDRIDEVFHTVKTFNAPRPSETVYEANGSIAVEECGKEFFGALCKLANYLCDSFQSNGIDKNLLGCFQYLVDELNKGKTISSESLRENINNMAKANAKESLMLWISQNTGKGMDPEQFKVELENKKKQILEALLKALYGSQNIKRIFYDAVVGECQVRCNEEMQHYEQRFIEEQKQKAEKERLRQKAEREKRQRQEAEERTKKAQEEAKREQRQRQEAEERARRAAEEARREQRQRQEAEERTKKAMEEAERERRHRQEAEERAQTREILGRVLGATLGLAHCVLHHD